MVLPVEDYIRAVDEHARLLADAATRIDLATPSPDCPGWSVRDVVEHTASVHRWAASHVREGGTANRAAIPTPKLSDDDLLAYFHAGHTDLTDSLRRAPDDLEAFRFLHDAPPARLFWARRQAHETAIHRSDVEVAAGSPPHYDPEFADDGIDELLAGFYGRRSGRLRLDTPRTLVVRTTDTDGSWSITIGPDRPKVLRAPVSEVGDCRIEGPAAAIYPFLWNRTVAIQPSIDGDETVLSTWRKLARVVWS